MKLKEITVSIGGTINIGNFENLRIDLSATATVPDGADVSGATQILTTLVREALVEQLAEVSRNARGSHVFAALEDIGARADAEKESGDEPPYVGF